MNPPQSKALPPAKRLYAPCGAARRRRAQENAQAWKSAGHSVSGARSQSAVYLPSCLAISPAKFRPARLAGRGAPIFIRLGRNESAPIQGFASGKTLVRAMRRGPPEAGAGERAGMEKRRTLSVRRSKPICGLLAQLLGDLLSEVPPRFSFDWGGMNPPQSKALPPAKRLYAPCGAARRRRAQENARAWKSAGHSVSGARSQSAVYLPSCLAISSAKFRPDFHSIGAD